MKKEIYDIFIIGAGPAGMTASIYASRANYKTAMIDKDAPGGKVLKTSVIENWTGYKKVLGPDLALEMFEHAIAFGTKHLFGEVVKINKIRSDLKEVITKDNKTFLAKTIIIATGTKEKALGIEGESALYGNGISYCAICEAPFFKEQKILVIGGGNSALEEALYLSKFGSKVVILYRKDKFFRAEKTTIDKVLKNSKIEVIYNATPIKIAKVNKEVILNYKHLEEDKVIKGAVLFPFIGLIPESNFILEKELFDNNHYLIGDKEGITSVPGVFIAGDICVKKVRQIATAVGDGCNAAQNAIWFLDKKNK